MTQNEYKISVPGKLFLAGEYSVANYEGTALLVPTTNAIELIATLTDQKVGILNDTDINFGTWHYDAYGKAVSSNPFFNSFMVAINFLNDSDIFTARIPIFNLQSKSDLLRKATNQKLGLGSSATSLVGFIKLIMDLMDATYGNLEIFKISALIAFKLNRNGSQADIAVATYAKPLVFYNYNHDKIKKLYVSAKSVNALVNAKWPGLEIKTIEFPPDWHVTAGWTGEPFSTEDTLVKLKTDKQWPDFVNQNNNYVNELIKYIHEENFHEFQRVFNQLNENYLYISKLTATRLMTDKLKKLVDTAQNLGFASKISGSGGGDCGIAITNESSRLDKLIIQWEQNGIIPINKIHEENLNGQQEK